MKDTRRESRPLTAGTMAAYVRDEHPMWLENYTKDKKDAYTAYESLLRLLRRFAYRHRFVQRTPHGLKTGIYFDAPPGQILSERGQSSAITAQQKHSAQLTAVCTVRGDGVKLPLLFIVRGEQNGTIEKDELPPYPKGHVYTVLTKAWMDARVWKFYLRSQQHLTGRSLLLVDNLECHVSGESEAIVSEELKAVLQPLPKNSTSVCQPLAVGIMGPLKAKLKALWLLEKNTATTAKEKRLATIKRAISAWESIEAETVTKAFNKALKTNYKSTAASS
ncbi:unnamed protein product [Phytophthora fragariaefolia]|uniref:Unnamed protein product n=1 Tax=Phytophthora fragariaefolia TaxID=1490495 RepID=A0A9W6Y380_9STRA|nr:unnamed protein product [Phytophthora fragariaefolia]